MGIGMSMLVKQIASGAQYAVQELSNEHESTMLPSMDARTFSDIDPDMLDLPRFKTAASFRATIPEEHKHIVKIYQINLLHTITDKPTNAQFLILYNKLPNRQAYTDHVCTCGSHVRSGVPCRHF